jgi:hypothetical protein
MVLVEWYGTPNWMHKLGSYSAFQVSEVHRQIPDFLEKSGILLSKFVVRALALDFGGFSHIPCEIRNDSSESEPLQVSQIQLANN